MCQSRFYGLWECDGFTTNHWKYEGACFMLFMLQSRIGTSCFHHHMFSRSLIYQPQIKCSDTACFTSCCAVNMLCWFMEYLNPDVWDYDGKRHYHIAIFYLVYFTNIYIPTCILYIFKYIYDIYVICHCWSSECIFMLHYTYDHALALQYPKLHCLSRPTLLQQKATQRQWLVGNGFSFILNFRLPDVQLVIGWSVAEAGYKIRWFTFPAAPILRHHPWTSYGQNDFLYSNGFLIFSLAFTYYMHIDVSSNFFIFPKQKRPAILGFVSCTFGRMQIGWILHKVCSFVGTGWAHHHVVLWW